jgi:hypothetical protein
MSNLLSTAKQVLIEGAMQTYDTFRNDIELSKEEYRRHYSNLGEVIFNIDSTEAFSELIRKLEVGQFEQIGYFLDDEDMLVEFLKVVNESR